MIEEGGKVKAFLEKDLSRPGPGVINGGIYVLKREILDLVRDLPCSLEQQVFPALVERGEIAGREFDGYFLDIGLPETLEQGHRELPNVRVRPAAFFARGALVNASGEDAVGWRAGAVEAVRSLNDRGYHVFVPPPRTARSTGKSRTASPSKGRMSTGSTPPEGSSGPAALDRAMSEWPIAGARSFSSGVRAAKPRRRGEPASPRSTLDGGDLAGLVRGASTNG